MKFIRLSHDGVIWNFDRDVSNAILLVFIRGWGRWFTCCYFFSTLVCCYWCILIIIIIPVVRLHSLIGPHWSVVVLFDPRFPSFGNFDSTILIEVVGMKSYIDCLFDPTCVPVGVTTNKLSLAPNSLFNHINHFN